MLETVAWLSLLEALVNLILAILTLYWAWCATAEDT